MLFYLGSYHRVLVHSIYQFADVYPPNRLLPGCIEDVDCADQAVCCLDGSCAGTIDDCGEQWVLVFYTLRSLISHEILPHGSSLVLR